MKLFSSNSKDKLPLQQSLPKIACAGALRQILQVLIIIAVLFAGGANAQELTNVPAAEANAGAGPNAPESKNFNFKILGCAVAGFGLLGLMGWLAWNHGETKEYRRLSLLILSFGFVLGWLIAMLLTPYPDETVQFTQIGAGFAALLSGYLLAKLDRLLDHMLQPASALQKDSGFHLLLFVTSLILSFILVFVFRQYTKVHRPPPNQTQKNTQHTNEPTAYYTSNVVIRISDPAPGK